MADWNVVVTTPEHGFRKAKKFLGSLGPVKASSYRSVLVLEVADSRAFLAALAQRIEAEPGLRDLFAHASPADVTFAFQSPAEFEDKARAVVLGWVPRLAGKSFHVRLHRRGFKGRLSSPVEERFLDGVLLEALAAAGAPGRIAFDDPDVIIAINTIDNRAGIALLTRAEREAFAFLGFDS